MHAFEEVLADPNYVPTAYIRERVPRNSAKTDPVRRGEQQRQEQKRYTIPGQNKHTQLRWDVREKLRENVVSSCHIASVLTFLSHFAPRPCVHIDIFRCQQLTGVVTVASRRKFD